MIRLRIAALLALGLTGGLLCASQAWAATTCSATMSSLVFGSTDVTGYTAATASLSVTCTTSALPQSGNAKVRMCLGIGKAADPRAMLNATSDTLNFQMYQNPAYSTIWGSSLGSAPANEPLQVDLDYAVPISTGGSSTQAYTLYGRIPPQVSVAAGIYTDSYAGNNTDLAFQYNTSTTGAATYPVSCTTGGTAGTTGTFGFEVTSTVPASCQFSSATDLSFGSHAGPITSAQDNTSSVTMICRNRTAWNLGLDNGQNHDGGTRRMRLGSTGNYVSYQLFRDSSHNLAWGSTIGTDTATGTGTGSAQSQTVYGHVPATQNVPAGSYSDTITVTVTY
ncbi:Csu type fimbrial protein [Variovorax sp. LjRoot178]|uniref:Csu type fimbrial protein n=1 Tax=Variovorax sp. LjRoot178 TaxID=3342277 RepID=UPI003ECDAB45